MLTMLWVLGLDKNLNFYISTITVKLNEVKHIFSLSFRLTDHVVSQSSQLIFHSFHT